MKEDEYGTRRISAQFCLNKSAKLVWIHLLSILLDYQSCMKPVIQWKLMVAQLTEIWQIVAGFVERSCIEFQANDGKNDDGKE